MGIFLVSIRVIMKPRMIWINYIIIEMHLTCLNVAKANIHKLEVYYKIWVSLNSYLRIASISKIACLA